MKLPSLFRNFVLIIQGGFSLSSHATEITWQAPFNITSDANIDTNGTLVNAVNATSGGDSPIVLVGGENILFSASAIAPSNTGTGGFFTGDGGDTGNDNLNTVLNSHSYAGGGWSLELSGLTPGTNYQIQLIGAGDTRGCCSSRNQRAGDDESPENLSGDFSRSGGGSVIGTFTADGTAADFLVVSYQRNLCDRQKTPEVPTLVPVRISDRNLVNGINRH